MGHGGRNDVSRLANGEHVAPPLWSNSLNGGKPDRFQPTCTVVICTRNRPTELDRCLDGVAHLDYPQFDVLVVNNAPNDDRAWEVAARWGVSYLVEPVPGASHARNLAVRSCETEIIAFCDDDAVPEPRWLARLAREFEDTLVMAVGGRIIALSVESQAERFFDCIGGFDCGLERRVVDRDTPFWFELANFGGLGDGNMAFRRVAFNLWPGFHENLGPGTPSMLGEEHHAFYSLIALGYRVVYSPDAVVQHPYPRTMEELRARQTRQLKATMCYIALMLVEEPDYRWPTLKYALEGLWGRPRIWRGQRPISHFGILPLWRRLTAYFSGPLLYARSRFSIRPVLEQRSPPVGSHIRRATGHSRTPSCDPSRLSQLT